MSSMPPFRFCLVFSEYGTTARSIPCPLSFSVGPQVQSIPNCFNTDYPALVSLLTRGWRGLAVLILGFRKMSEVRLEAAAIFTGR